MFFCLLFLLATFGARAQTTVLKVVQDTVKILNGNLRIAKLPNNATEDNILTTDVNGNVKLKAAPSSGWGLTGNAGTDPNTNFIGTTDAQPLIFKVNNLKAGLIDPTYGNVALGKNALRSNVPVVNTTGYQNTAIGTGAMANSTSVTQNVAVGYMAYKDASNGINNVAVGYYALGAQQNSNNNVAIGWNTMGSSSNGANNNVVIGYNSMTLAGGNENTIIGSNSGNTDGSPNWTLNGNATLGANILWAASNASYNSIVGDGAGSRLQGDVSYNNYFGYKAGLGNDENNFDNVSAHVTLLGDYTYANGLNSATAVGSRAMVECSNCLVLGAINGKNDATANTNVGIGTTIPLKIFDVTSTQSGVLLPRLTTTQMNAIASPLNGEILYNTDNSAFYYYNGTSWAAMGGGTSGGGSGSYIQNSTTQQSASNFNISGNGLIGGSLGLNTATATNTLTFGTGSTGFSDYKTTDQASAYEKVVGQWQSNVYTLGSYYGTGASTRSIQIGVQGVAATTTLAGGRTFTISDAATSTSGVFDFNGGTTSGTPGVVTIQGTGNASSGTQNWVSIQPTISQTGTAGYSALLVSPYDAGATGTGTRYLINAGTSSAANGGGTFTQRFSVRSGGKTKIGTVTDANSAWLQVGGANQSNAWGVSGVLSRFDAGTYTDLNSTGTVSTVTVANSFGAPVFTSSSAVTYTTAANVYIAGPPTATSPATITNPYSLYVASGQNFLGGNTVVSGILTTGNGTNSDLFSGGTTNAGTTNNPALLFGSATAINYRAGFNGGTSTVLTAGNNYVNTIVGSAPLTSAGTGTHALLANEVVNPIGTITSGGATITETSSLYVNGASSAGTNNYALHVAGSSAQSKIDGSITVSNGVTVSGGTTKLSTGMVMKRTAVADANYTILTTDYIVAYPALTAARSVTLPSSGVTTGQEFIIKDESGNAGTYNITVVGTIDGAANKVLNTAYGTVRLYYNGTGWFTY